VVRKDFKLFISISSRTPDGFFTIEAYETIMGEERLTQNAINRLLVDLAGCANIVVRLKGGDPSIFGCAARNWQGRHQRRALRFARLWPWRSIRHAW
jgi:hypothetical protein